MSQAIQDLLSEPKAGLGTLYGTQLWGVYLYGSYARGQQEEDSDADVLIVLRRLGRYGAEIERTSELISSLSLSYGVSVSRVFVTENAWRNGETDFLVNVRREAVAA